MFAAVFYSLLLAQALPPVTCRRDDSGECILNYTGTPLWRVHSNDRAQALEFYRPYFTCYYNHLSKSAGFGSSDSEVATEAMLEASKDCDDERSLADQLLNDLLVKRKVYGDESHRAVVVELFRREEGSDFVFAMALEDGVSGQLKIMSDAYFEKVLSPQ